MWLPVFACLSILRSQCSCDSSGNLRKSVNGEHIRIAMDSTINRPYIYYINVNGTQQSRLTGFNIQVIETLSAILNFTYDIVFENCIGSSGYIVGFDGVLGRVERCEADIGFPPLWQTSDRRSAVRFLHPMYKDTMAFVVNPTLMKRMPPQLLLMPFSNWVWIGMALSSLVVVACLVAVNVAQTTDVQIPFVRYTLESMWATFSIWLQKMPSTTVLRVDPNRCISGSWSMLTFLMYVGYTSNMMSLIVVQQYLPLWNDTAQLSKLIESHKIRLVGTNESIDRLFYSLKTLSDRTQFESYRKAIMDTEPVRVNTDAEIAAAIMSDSSLIYHDFLTAIKSKREIYTSCDLLIKHAYGEFASIFASTCTPYAYNISLVMSTFTEAFYDRVMSNHTDMPRPDICPNMNQPARLSFELYTWVFVTLLIGLILSITTFTLEARQLRRVAPTSVSVK